MNFLAHLYLSGNTPAIQVGNFIGDFIKGKALHTHFDPDVLKGIELHRAIDEYTDHHPVVMESKVRLRPKYRHYAPVLVDMFYDHFLSKHWRDYHSTPLPEYTQTIYAMLENWKDLPPPVYRLLTYMKQGDWLVNYGTLDGLNRALTGMSSRTKFTSHMEHATKDLQLHYADYEREFQKFFPDLIEFCQTYLKKD